MQCFIGVVFYCTASFLLTLLCMLSCTGIQHGYVVSASIRWILVLTSSTVLRV